MNLDHERLDVYQVSLDFAAWSYEQAKHLKAVDRHARDQLLRASQSITLNIAEGCGKLPSPERRRFLQIAGDRHGSAAPFSTSCPGVRESRRPNGRPARSCSSVSSRC